MKRLKSPFVSMYWPIPVRPRLSRSNAYLARTASGSKSGPSMRGVSTTTESSMTIISWLICVKKSDIRGSAGASHKVFHSSKTIHRSSRRRDSPCAVVARRTGASWGFEQSPQGLLSRRRAVQAHGSANTAAPSASPRPADVGGSRGSDCLLGPENLGEEVGNLGHGLTRMWQLPAIHGEEAMDAPIKAAHPGVHAFGPQALRICQSVFAEQIAFGSEHKRGREPVDTGRVQRREPGIGALAAIGDVLVVEPRNLLAREERRLEAAHGGRVDVSVRARIDEDLGGQCG